MLRKCLMRMLPIYETGAMLWSFIMLASYTHESNYGMVLVFVSAVVFFAYNLRLDLIAWLKEEKESSHRSI